MQVTVQTTKIDQLLENNTKTKALIEATPKKSFSTASKYMYKSYYKNHMYLKMKKNMQGWAIYKMNALTQRQMTGLPEMATQYNRQALKVRET